jgi:hypothetical protein
VPVHRRRLDALEVAVDVRGEGLAHGVRPQDEWRWQQRRPKVDCDCERRRGAVATGADAAGYTYGG